MSDLVEQLRDFGNDPYFHLTPGVQEWLQKNDIIKERAAAHILELEAENKKLKEALKPFQAMQTVLDCRDMGSDSDPKHQTIVGISVPFDVEKQDDTVLAGEVPDGQVILSACASAYGTPASFVYALTIGHFRHAAALEAKP